MLVIIGELTSLTHHRHTYCHLRLTPIVRNMAIRQANAADFYVRSNVKTVQDLLLMYVPRTRSTWQTV